MKSNGPVTHQPIDYPDDAVFVSRTDLKGVIVDANPSFIEISGYVREELIGHSHNKVRHPDMPSWVFGQLWNTIRSGHVWRGIIKNRTKTGDHYWVRAIVSPIIRSGTVDGYLSYRKKPEPAEIAAAEALYSRYPGTTGPVPTASLRRWFAGLNLQRKLQMVIQPIFLVVLTTLTVSTYIQVRDSILEDAIDKSKSVAMEVIDGANMLMVTGAIGATDNRRLLIRKIVESQHLQSLRLIRTEQVVSQYGAGLPEEQLDDPLVRRTIDESVRAGTPLPRFLFKAVGDKHFLRAITPYLESHNFHGTDCLLCHRVKEGSSNGASDIVMDLSPAFNRLYAIVWVMLAGQIIAQILLYLVIRWTAQRFVAQPLAEVASHLDEVVAGDFNRPVVIDGRDEVGELLGKIQSTKALLGATIDCLNVQATMDTLTGIPNRRYFVDLAEREFVRCQRYGNPMAVAMVDLDRFKSINDTYGHLVGDQVLQRFAELCKKMLRRADIVGRIGGEEFALMLPNTQALEAGEVVERLRQAVEKSCLNIGDNRTLCVTASFGVAICQPDDVALVDLFKRADDALYKAKHTGRNKVISYLEEAL